MLKILLEICEKEYFVKLRHFCHLGRKETE